MVDMPRCCCCSLSLCHGSYYLRFSMRKQSKLTIDASGVNVFLVLSSGLRSCWLLMLPADLLLIWRERRR